MAALLCAVTVMLATFPGHVVALLVGSAVAQDSECNKVVFDRIDKELHVRTMVVEDSSRQRMLVLTAENDTSMPCAPRWWLDHNPQGAVQCLGSTRSNVSSSSQACNVDECKADAGDVQLGYVRTMLASTIFVPQAHAMSAICVALGCRSRITKVTSRHAGNLLETPKVQWAPRVRLQRVLIIGLGSSTMALWVRQQLPDTELHVAELVPGVAAAAPCFGLDSASGGSKLHMHVGDGRSVLQNMADGFFDAILVDAFDHDASLPPCFRTSEFFAIARRKLLPGGALSFNLYSDGKSKTRIVKALTKSFDNSRIWVGDAPGAEGIQEVITAFAPGRALARTAPADALVLGHARAWWERAHFAVLRSQVIQDAKPFEDVTECPDKNTLHHG